MLFSTALEVGSNFLLTVWSNANDSSDNIYYIKIYAIFAGAYAFFSLIRSVLILWRSIKCSKLIHDNMMLSVIRAPINTFFDRIPTGRILNRISKDLVVLDDDIALSFGFVMVCFFSLFADIFICIFVGSYWAIPAVFVFFILTFWIQRVYMKINREAVRMESISKSPIVNFYSESLNGLSTIRSYVDEQRFFEVLFSHKII